MWTRNAHYVVVETLHPLEKAINLVAAGPKPDNHVMSVLIHKTHLTDLMTTFLDIP